jgi:drug/metabolite transporter (DMT)-like permease
MSLDSDLSDLNATPANSSHAMQRQGLLFALLAVACFSTGPIFVRWASVSLGVYEIGAWRLLLAGSVIVGVALARGEGPLPWGDWRRFLLFGLITALHFGFFIASLNFTTVAHSLAIVYTAPIFTALLSWRRFGEAPAPRQWAGIALSVAGVGIMAGLEPNWTQRMAIGDLLALGSAITFTFYGLAGRSQRQRYPLLVYVGCVYLMAGFWFVPAAIATFSAGGYTLPAILSVLGIALFPTGLGHTFFNDALRRSSATVVSVIATQEVTLGILLGVVLLGEIPSLAAAGGVIVTLIGVALVIL